jgi:hypothetical protein
MFMWPTSLLPIWPSGKPTAGPEVAISVVGKILNEMVIGWFARQSDGVAFAFGAIAPAVQHSEYDGFRSFGHSGSG